MRDALGNRIKSQYEDRARFMLPRRTYTVIRIDGKTFHTYTRDLQKPFDKGLIDDIDGAVVAIMPEIQGAQFAYVQSDEISILLTDFAEPTTSAWFDGNVQKMASVSASMMTAEFNKLRQVRHVREAFDKALANPVYGDSGCEMRINTVNENLACFDARVFTIPDWIEVYNYFVWRNQDCARNSVQMVARSLYSHKECADKSCAELKGMIFDKGGEDWAANDGLKYGRLIIKETCQDMVAMRPRTRWATQPAYLFTERPAFIQSMIPKYS